MVGLPYFLQTKQDWVNAVEYAKEHPQVKYDLIERLRALQGNKTIKVLKSLVQKPAEELTPDDFEEVIDQGSYALRLGISESDIHQFIKALGG